MLGLVNHFKLKIKIKRLHNENQALTVEQKKLQEELSAFEALQPTTPIPEDHNLTVDSEV
jgi:regulator of replication initiation timing